MNESRTIKSLLNARVNSFYYFIMLFMSFYTRKIFLDYLGTEFMGMTSTLGSLLGFLSLTELGIGAAVGFTLYKPLAEKNQEEVKKIISILGYLYSKIGYVILGGGIILSLFLPIIFKSSNIPWGLTYFAFYSYLASSLFGYYLNYPSTVFYADQRGYEITRYSQAILILKLLCYILLAKIDASLYLYLGIEFSFSFTSTILIQWRIRKVYPWLKTHIKEGKSYLKEYPSIITKTKQIFIHKIATLAQYQLSPIIIYGFSNLTSVTLYANYTLITSKLSSAVESFLGSTSSSIGNLVAENNKKKTKQVFYEILSLRFFIGGYFTFMLYKLTEPFIRLWLGQEFVLGNDILLILLAINYISYIRNATDQFISAYGLFQDTWAPITEAIICIITSIGLGYFFGLAGVILGNLISLIAIVIIWKPYFLFSMGFKDSVREYWKAFALRIAIMLTSCVTTSFLVNLSENKPITSYVVFVCYCFALSFIYIFIYITTSFIFDNSFKSLVKRIRVIAIDKF